ncbi:aminoglycoside phosphotransferase family protein [Nocardioides panacis]|uniref:aminoglycoside phosphotransferase family protein n=1 Tax=Nocardioides panacis TaxID=2849501 RepID=UPI0020B2F2F4|nr:aminoglycoside phosphotransferase family protein [Nocardioides panacis]
MPLPFAIPPTFTAYAGRGERFATYLAGLPRLVDELVSEWQLTHDGPPWHGQCALVVPVRTACGRPAVLKVTYPHDEAEHEHLGLRAWHGDGAVQLLRADPRRWALLLERLHAEEDLTPLWDVEACEIVGGLYQRLHVPALPQLRRLSSYVDRWTTRLADLPVDAPLPRRLVEQAVSLGRDLVGDPATDARTIHGDLHYENVLAADREPWLAIDPKPMAGDPHYEPAPMLWNRWDDVVASGHVRDAVRRRFFTLVDAAGLDEQRARAWVVVREMHNALWVIEDAVTARRALDADDRAALTAAVTIAKAVQD